MAKAEAARRFKQVLGAIIFGCLVGVAASAESATISLRVNQFADAGGNLTYEFSALPYDSFVQLTAPDGTVLDYASPRFTGLTYAELSQRFVGQWTVDNTFPSPPGPVVATHYFTLSPLPVLPVPTLTLPADGATVGTTIDMAWTYPPGEQISANSARGHAFAPLDFNFTGDGQATVTVDLTGMSSDEVELWGGGWTNLLNYLSPVTPSDTPFELYTLQGGYATYSAPVAVTVVPEPSAYMLAMVGAVALFAVRRRVRRSR